MSRDVFDIRLVLAENNRRFLFVSFLCSGSAMNVAYGPVELKKFLQEAARVSQVSSLFLIFCGVRAGRKSSLPESMIAISSQVGISPDLSFFFKFRTILL